MNEIRQDLSRLLLWSAENVDLWKPLAIVILAAVVIGLLGLVVTLAERERY